MSLAAGGVAVTAGALAVVPALPAPASAHGGQAPGHEAAVGQSATAKVAEARGRNALLLWWGPQREDNFTSGTAAGDAAAQSSDYSYVRNEGFCHEDQVSGTVPLYLFWNGSRGDNFSTATQAGIDAARSAGYTQVRVECYVYPEHVSGTVPLYLFWNGSRGDNFSTATQAGIDAARSAGYTQVRVEGYVYPS